MDYGWIEGRKDGWIDGWMVIMFIICDNSEQDELAS